MKTYEPMATDEVREFYRDGDTYPHGIESYTCSTECSHCNTRIWFHGSWGNDMVPTRFACPSCKATNHDPYMDTVTK